MTGDKVEKDKMAFAHLSDLEMAGKVRMLYRSDLDHEAVCVGARDRIMYLSQQHEELQRNYGLLQSSFEANATETIELRKKLNGEWERAETATRLAEQLAGEWRKEPPGDTGYWWWWNEDGPPVPVNIFFRGCERRYFATVG